MNRRSAAGPGDTLARTEPSAWDFAPYPPLQLKLDDLYRGHSVKPITFARKLGVSGRGELMAKFVR